MALHYSFGPTMIYLVVLEVAAPAPAWALRLDGGDGAAFPCCLVFNFFLSIHYPAWLDGGTPDELFLEIFFNVCIRLTKPGVVILEQSSSPRLKLIRINHPSKE